MGWVSRPPVAKGGQNFGVSAQSNAVHSTRLDNLFVESPLHWGYIAQIEDLLTSFVAMNCDYSQNITNHPNQNSGSVERLAWYISPCV